MDNSELKILQRLRLAYLDGTAGASDYWQSEADLDIYDRTYAQRIGWKWRYVLQELERLEWKPPLGLTLADWGCGSGIAGRAVAKHFGAENFSRLLLYDRSKLAMQFAAQKARNIFPELPAMIAANASINDGIIIASHLITELSPAGLDAFINNLRNAQAILWVEPGTYAASRALIYAREKLRSEFYVIAPCIHSDVCGMTHPAQKRHWCHFFAKSPEEAFTEREWAQFAEKIGIDMSDLPLSYLILDKRQLVVLHPAHALRVIARPHITSSDAVAVQCSAAGVSESIIQKRKFPELWRSFKKHDFDTLQNWQKNGREVIEIE